MSRNWMTLALLMPLVGCGMLSPQEPAPVDVVVDVETPPADDGEAGDENTAMDEAAGGEVDTDAGAADEAGEAPVAVDETTTTKTTTTTTTTSKKIAPVVSTGNRAGTTDSVKPVVTGNRSGTTEGVRTTTSGNRSGTTTTTKPKTTVGGNRSGTK